MPRPDYLLLIAIAGSVSVGCAATSSLPSNATSTDAAVLPSDTGSSSTSDASLVDAWDAGPSEDASDGDQSAVEDAPADSDQASEGGALENDASSDAAPTGAGDVEVDVSKPGAAVPANFQGISVEWSDVLDYLGNGNGGAKPTVAQLLRNFEDDGHTVFVRIGGNSDARMWWTPSTRPEPAGLTVSVNAKYFATLAALHAATNSDLIVGLNLATGDAVNASEMAKAALATLPAGSLKAFELGNEPSDMPTHGWRPASYTYAQYQTEFDTFLDGITTNLGSAPPYAGPALQGLAWLPDLDAYIAHEKGRIAFTTVHKYPTGICSGKAPPAPTDLLLDSSTLLYPMIYGPHIGPAHAAGMQFRVDEMNTVACGGVVGVSDVYVAALWAADASFELAAAGADGLHFHTTTGPYAVFDASGAARPLYYGMRFFSLATAHNGKLLPLSNSLTTHVHAWAMLGDDGAVRIVLLNLEPTAGGVVTLGVGGRTRATLVRMRAPSLTASTGLTLAGQTWAGSVDGKPVGTFVTEPVPSDGATLSVMLPALEAVVITVTP